MKTIGLKLIYLVLLCIIFIGCYSQKKLTKTNPTSYIFNSNIEEVRNAIKNGFKDYQMECVALYSKEDFENGIFNTNIKFDAILNSFCSVNSKIYYKSDKPLPYNASFHLHLDSISESKTKVEVFTLDPEIYVWGIGIWGHSIHSQIKKVPPSTIEEYEILLTIGEQLGEKKDMPACNYPKK
jgi:hypothetical protein